MKRGISPRIRTSFAKASGRTETWKAAVPPSALISAHTVCIAGRRWERSRRSSGGAATRADRARTTRRRPVRLAVTGEEPFAPTGRAKAVTKFGFFTAEDAERTNRERTLRDLGVLCGESFPLRTEAHRHERATGHPAEGRSHPVERWMRRRVGSQVVLFFRVVAQMEQFFSNIALSPDVRPIRFVE